MKNLFWVKLMNWVLIGFIVLLSTILLTLPFLAEKYVDITGVYVRNILLLQVFFYLTAIPFMILLIMIKKLCNNILRNDPFCESSITALNGISICAFIDFLLYVFFIFINMKSLLSFVLMVAAFMIGLVSLVLSQLFKVTIEMKLENDLTI